MFCQKCGKEITEGVAFCSHCGAPAQNAVQTASPQVQISKKKHSTIVIATVLLIAFAVAGIFLFNRKQNEIRFSNQLLSFQNDCAEYQLGDMEAEYDALVKEASEALERRDNNACKAMKEKFEDFKSRLDEYAKELESYSGKMEAYQNIFDKFPLTAVRKQKCETLLTDLDNALTEGSISRIKQYIASLDSFCQSCEREILDTIDAKYEKITAFSSSNLLTAEEHLMNTYLDTASANLEQGDYIGVMEEYDKCFSLLSDIEKSGSYAITIEQIDVSSFPIIKLYVSANQSQTTADIELSEKYITLREMISGAYQELPVNKMNRLDEKENLNVCLVADESGSMWKQIDFAKAAMTNFLNCLQYNVGDKAAIITFDNFVNINTDFIGQINVLTNIVNNMYVGNCTALYDALYVAVCNASRADGAKCVIAFTDGYDNVSTVSAQDVIDAANLYGVPIYLIGIGYDVDGVLLQSISHSTGGYYWNIFDVNAIQDIYNSIYQENKELYLVEYTTQVPDIDTWQNIYLSYGDGDKFMRCEASFQPSQLKASQEEYSDLVQDNGIANSDIEDEVLRIRKIYNEIVQNRENGRYTETNLGNGVTGYRENGHMRCIVVPKGVDDVDYARFYYYENDKLIFAYIEANDSHRLYFYNEKLFRWRYASNAVNFSEADNHDNEDSAQFREWEAFALKEGCALAGR